MTRTRRQKRLRARTPPERCSPSGKIIYRGLDDARHAQLLCSKYSGKPIWIYVCPECGTWHLTKVPQH